MYRIKMQSPNMSMHSFARRRSCLACFAMSVLLVCPTIFFAQTQPKSAGPSNAVPSASEVLQSAINALSHAETLDCEVRQISSSSSALGSKALTKVVIAFASPKRYWARLQSDEPPKTEMSVWNGKVNRISAEGKAEEFPAICCIQAAGVAAETMKVFNPDTYRKALAGNNILYAGQDDVEGDLCNVVGVSSPVYSAPLGEWVVDPAGSDTTYYWISARTGLPRSDQAYRITKGSTLLTYRLVWSNIHLNPAVPADLFEYHPSAADSITAATKEPSAPSSNGSAGNSAAALTSIQRLAWMTGKQVPDLEVRDPEYRPVSLPSLIKGKATLISLWATWCAPCNEELPVFQQLQKRYAGRLQIVTILVQDSRLNLPAWIKRFPQYNFVRMTDPAGAEPGSSLLTFFGGSGGVPRNALVDPQGRIVDFWTGYGGKEDELISRVDKFMGRLKNSH